MSLVAGITSISDSSVTTSDNVHVVLSGKLKVLLVAAKLKQNCVDWKWEEGYLAECLTAT